MAKRAAQGAGTIRKKTVIRNGKEYTYWEARITTGRDPGTGKQVQRSFTGKTQKEVREKMQAAAVAVNTGTYITPQKMTVGQWLDTWAKDYLIGAKPATATIYKNNIKNHIKPALGAVGLSDLHPHMVQQFINGMELSSASIRLAYKVLQMAMEKAAKLEYIPKNPAAGSELPKLEQKEIHPLDDQQVAILPNSAKGEDIEHLITVALFTGCRLSELLGLTWDAVDFQKGTITINKQLARTRYRANTPFASPKNGRCRIITPAASVLNILRRQWRRQAEMKLKAGVLWANPYNLVFTDEAGGIFDHNRAGRHFKSICNAAGLVGVRFHDLRHTYAVSAIRAGDDIKTIQGNLGHATASFTLDRYGHFTERMREDSAARMEGFIKAVFGL